MANDSAFQEQIRQLGKLVTQFEQLPESTAKTAGKEIIQLLMDVHGAGLERMMEIVFDSGAASPDTIQKLGQDTTTGILLLLYSLHPEDLRTRVEKAIDRMRPRLRKLSCAVELVSVHETEVKLRLAVAGHACGSSSEDMHAIVEDAVYEFAPEVTLLSILGLEEQAPGGFVSLESLTGRHQPAVLTARESGD